MTFSLHTVFKLESTTEGMDNIHSKTGGKHGTEETAFPAVI